MRRCEAKEANCCCPTGIDSWEFGLRFDGPLAYIGFTIPYNHNSAVFYPNFIIVSVPTALEPEPVMHLMTLFFQVTGSDLGNIYIENSNLPPGGTGQNYLPAYISEGGTVVNSLYPSSGSIDLPVFRLNAEAPVAVESLAWSHVKALYR